MTNDSQSRKWQITINNSIDKGFTHQKIDELLKTYKGLLYYCLSDEEGGKEHTFHTHVYVVFSSSVRFSSLLSKFNGAHFEMCKGSSEQNRDYVFKQGKHSASDKGAINYADSHVEYGTMPVERQGKRNDLDDLYDMVKSGMSTIDILEDNPSYMNYLDKIDRVRTLNFEKEYMHKFRQVHVEYIFGPTGCGKTRSIFDSFGYDKVYRVTDYSNPFDNYNNEPVVVFDEFYNSLSLEKMLVYLDGHPLRLSARYANKVACYDKVYIISNSRFENQFTYYLAPDKIEQYRAFCRRINYIVEYTAPSVLKTYTPSQYLNGFHSVDSTPFDDTKTEQLSLFRS